MYATLFYTYTWQLQWPHYETNTRINLKYRVEKCVAISFQEKGFSHLEENRK